jgi:hypothetical protein
MQSCSTEETVLDSNANKKNYITSEKVSLENVLSVIKNPIILNQTETFKSNYSVNTLQKSTEKTNVYFTKIVKGDEYSTFLLLLNRYSKSKPYFMYYIITDRDNVQKAAFVKYIPDTPAILLDHKNFTGKIQMLDTNLKIRLNSRFVNGKEQKQNNSTTARANDNCTTSTVLITHYCSEDIHVPGQENCTAPGKAYYELSTDTTCFYESSYDNSAPLPNEFVNGFDGIGGGGANADIEIVNFEMIYLDANQKMWWDNPDNLADKQILMDYLNQNPTDAAKEIVSEMITQMNGGRFAPKFDVKASLYSPMNIITSSIDTTTTEGKKFTEVYGALLTSPSFKELFVDLFGGPQTRFNVKFEISEHLFKDGDPATEVNAKTSFDGTPNLVIKINKQILSPTGSIPKVNIEIVKTILHECIHAYLFIKKDNINVGMDIAGVINSTYQSVDDQHDFMYNHMLPVMTKILGEIRDMVTFQAGRDEVQSLFMYPTRTPLTQEKWNWETYYKFLSINGLDDTSFFKNDFPKSTDSYNFYAQYNTYGHVYLNKK